MDATPPPDPGPPGLTVGELAGRLTGGPDPSRPPARTARVYHVCGPRLLVFVGDRVGADGSVIHELREGRADERAEFYRRTMPATAFPRGFRSRTAVGNG